MDDNRSQIVRIVQGILCLAMLAAVMGCHGGQQAGGRDKPIAVKGMITGTVKYVDLEGGFYGLVTDAEQKLDPVNLPDAFKEDGLRIQARVEQAKGRVSTHMWGPLVRIIEIERM